MATTVTPPTQEPSRDPSQREVGESARAALARRESPGRQIVRLVVLVVAVAVLVDGWIVTDINLGKLANAANAGPILGALLRPDIVSRDVAPVEMTVPVVVGAGSSSPATA